MPVDVHVADTLRAAYRVCLEQHQQTANGIPALSTQHKETRPLIINWLEEVSKGLCLKGRTFYWSVMLFDRYMEKVYSLGDRFMATHSSSIDSVFINSLACLFVAAKNYEIDPKVPSSVDFVSHLPS